MNNNEKLIDRFMSRTGLMSSIYGKYADNIIYNQRKEKAKLILFQVYGYRNIFDVLPPEVDDPKLMDHVRTLMSFDIYGGETKKEEKKQ